jgi:ankyrin repeat protein
VRLRAWRIGSALGALIALMAACESPGPAPQPVSTAPSPAVSDTATPSPASTKPGSAAQLRLDRELREAAWDNDIRRAQTLIRRGADVNAKDETEQSAYLIATSEGYLGLLDLTLEHGADVDSKDSFNGTGLIRAADRGHADIAGRLIRAGIEVDHVNNLGWTALLEAVILGDGSERYQEVVKILLNAGADRNLADRDGLTALTHAERRGQNAIAELLR